MSDRGENTTVTLTASCSNPHVQMLETYASDTLTAAVHVNEPSNTMSDMEEDIKTMLSSHMFMKNGGILGFHCAYQYPQTFEGTYYYERYPLTLKGTDAVLFTLFRTFGLTVHIKAYEEYCYGSIDGATKQCRGLTSTQDDTGAKSEAIPDFEHSYYVGDEVFQSVTWFNEWTAQEDGKEYHEVARPVTNWIGNETEVEWNYASLALLVVLPEFSKRELKDKV